MTDPRLNPAEWRLQHMFIKLLIAGAFLLLASDHRSDLPDRTPRPARLATLMLEPLPLPRDLGGGLRITDAWTLTSDDPRVFGLSALVVPAGERLQALSDSAVVVTFAKPGGPPRALVSELPDGPGYPTFKRFRDSEAMLAEGGGRLVAFENRHSLWRYENDGTARAVRVHLPTIGWKENKGIEAMVRDPADGALLLLHEGGRELIRITGARQPEVLPLAGATGGIADAVRLPDGRMVVAVREIGLFGLTNRLAWLERSGAGYRLRTFATLPLGMLDNVEGLAAEPGSSGGTLLWAITDSDGWRRSLLVRMEFAPPRRGGGSRASG
jgi:hypothetical protein